MPAAGVPRFLRSLETRNRLALSAVSIRSIFVPQREPRFPDRIGNARSFSQKGSCRSGGGVRQFRHLTTPYNGIYSRRPPSRPPRGSTDSSTRPNYGHLAASNGLLYQSSSYTTPISQSGDDGPFPGATPLNLWELLAAISAEFTIPVGLTTPGRPWGSRYCPSGIAFYPPPDGSTN